MDNLCADASKRPLFYPFSMAKLLAKDFFRHFDCPILPLEIIDRLRVSYTEQSHSNFTDEWDGTGILSDYDIRRCLKKKTFFFMIFQTKNVPFMYMLDYNVFYSMILSS